MPLNEALGVFRLMMKTLLLVVIFFSAQAWSIVPNTEYYKSAKSRIISLKLQVEEIEVTLSTQQDHKVELQLKPNIEKEIKLIEQRIELYKKLESKSLIMYTQP